MKRVFVSHASEDKRLATELVEFLENREIQCWFAARDVDAADDYAAQVVRAIDRAQAIVVIVSDAANSSAHVRRELDRAAQKPIVPLRLNEVIVSDALAYFLSSAQWIEVDPNRRRSAFEALHAVLTTGPKQLRHRPPLPLADLLRNTSLNQNSKARHGLATTALFCSATVVLAPLGLLLGLAYLVSPGKPPEGRVVAAEAAMVGFGVVIVGIAILALIVGL